MNDTIIIAVENQEPLTIENFYLKFLKAETLLAFKPVPIGYAITGYDAHDNVISSTQLTTEQFEADEREQAITLLRGVRGVIRISERPVSRPELLGEVIEFEEGIILLSQVRELVIKNRIKHLRVDFELSERCIVVNHNLNSDVRYSDDDAKMVYNIAVNNIFTDEKIDTIDLCEISKVLKNFRELYMEKIYPLMIRENYQGTYLGFQTDSPIFSITIDDKCHLFIDELNYDEFLKKLNSMIYDYEEYFFVEMVFFDSIDPKKFLEILHNFSGLSATRVCFINLKNLRTELSNCNFEILFSNCDNLKINSNGCKLFFKNCKECEFVLDELLIRETDTVMNDNVFEVDTLRCVNHFKKFEDYTSIFYNILHLKIMMTDDKAIYVPMDFDKQIIIEDYDTYAFIGNDKTDLIVKNPNQYESIISNFRTVKVEEMDNKKIRFGWCKALQISKECRNSTIYCYNVDEVQNNSETVNIIEIKEEKEEVNFIKPKKGCVVLKSKNKEYYINNLEEFEDGCVYNPNDYYTVKNLKSIDFFENLLLRNVNITEIEDSEITFDSNSIFTFSNLNNKIITGKSFVLNGCKGCKVNFDKLTIDNCFDNIYNGNEITTKSLVGITNVKSIILISENVKIVKEVSKLITSKNVVEMSNITQPLELHTVSNKINIKNSEKVIINFTNEEKTTELMLNVKSVKLIGKVGVCNIVLVGCTELDTFQLDCEEINVKTDKVVNYSKFNKNLKKFNCSNK